MSARPWHLRGRYHFFLLRANGILRQLGRVHRCLLVILALTSVATSRAASTTNAPEQMPAMKVSADVPLRKIGEHTMLVRRFAPAAITHGDYIYIIGGASSDHGAEDSVERFNVRTGISEKFARLQTARLWHSAVLAGDSIYVLGGSVPTVIPGDKRGGFREGLAGEETVEVIDLTTRKVSQGPPLPEARTKFACVRVGGRIFVTGGVRKRGTRLTRTNTTWVLDLATRRWSEGPPMPTPRESVGTLVDGGFIIVPGGYDGTRARNEVEVFHPGNNRWSTLPPLSRAMSAHSLVFLGQHLFLFGDYDSPGTLLAYDLKTKQSETFTLGYTSARHNAAVAHDGKIYVIGGKAFRESTPLDLIQVFEPLPKSVARAAATKTPEPNTKRDGSR